MRAAKDRGQPLPPRYYGLRDLQAHFRRGQMSLIVAASGAGKTAFMSDYVLFADYSGEGDMIPTMYFSADSDESTVGDRITAAILRKDTKSTHELLMKDDEKTWRAQREATNHIWFNFDSNPTIEDIYNEVEAYCYMMGDYPHLIVIDVLMAVQAGGGSAIGTDALYNAMEAFHKLSRMTGAHVAVLHHSTGDFVDGDLPIPKKGIIGKIDKLPRLILTLYKPGPDLMGICVVKNSNGPADATAQEYQVHLPWTPANSWIGGEIK